MSERPDSAALRDLGFRPYVGARHPPSRNAWVLYRYGLARAWSSVLVKLALLFAWGPPVIALVAFAIFSYIAAQNPLQVPPPDLASYARRLTSAQLWLFASAVALGAGSAAIADDRARGAFVFYFTKPVLPRHYLLGRVLSVATLVAFVIAAPTELFAAAALAVRKTEVGLGDVRLFLAIALVAGLSALAVASVSIAVSSAFTSRALAAFTFAVLWLVPHLGSLLASAITDAPWLAFLSLPALSATLAEASFSSAGPMSASDALIAAAALVFVSVAALGFAHEHVARASETP